MTLIHVPGKKSAQVMLYALSTCGWCQKTKRLLNELGGEYDYEDVDQLQGAERDRALRVIEKWNPSGNFPTIIIENKKCIVGFMENDIKEALK